MVRRLNYALCIGFVLTDYIAMGKEVSDEERNKNDAAWDSNAITPGTPFMDLLAASLRYWVVKKMNTDPGWKEVRRHFSSRSSC